MVGQDLGALEIARKLGSEHFQVAGRDLDFDLLDFWAWCSSDLTNNTMRGVLAEYLVARDLGLAEGTRIEWDAYDLKTKHGLKVEVKSAAYLQSWHQTKPSSISFSIEPKYGWDASTNEYGTERARQADVYVFAVLHHRDKSTLNPLDVDQWDFYILPTAVLNERAPTQKKIALTRLEQFQPRKVRFGEISAALEDLFPS